MRAPDRWKLFHSGELHTIQDALQALSTARAEWYLEAIYGSDLQDMITDIKNEISRRDQPEVAE